jgi:hypothetical protein
VPTAPSADTPSIAILSLRANPGVDAEDPRASLALTMNRADAPPPGGAAAIAFFGGRAASGTIG